MRTLGIGLLLLASAAPCLAHGAGLAHNQDFIVLAPDQAIADQVLADADSFRQALAKEWLGEEIPAGAGRTVVTVSLRDGEDRGLTWATDPQSKRTLHRTWIRFSHPEAIQPLLHHECMHLVLATRFPSRLPPFIEEGAASQYDDQERIALRNRVLQQFVESGSFPGLADILSAESIAASDQQSYTVAASMTEYLLTRGGKKNLIQFGAAATKNGWDKALQEHYGISTVGALETAWQRWASGQVHARQLGQVSR